MPKRCLILIDGSNFYFKLKDLNLHNLLDFNFSKFSQLLAGINKIIETRYYIGKIKQDGTLHTEKLLANQQRLFNVLKKHQVNYSLGYLLKSNGVFHEKGVDVQIAVDMLVAAYENQCDKIILVSSDTDLFPAIKRAKQKGKIVEYVGFSHKPSHAMVRFCSESRMIRKKDIMSLISL